MPCDMPYGKALLIATDQWINAALRGWPDETLSSRCWRWHKAGKRSWPKNCVDALFFWDKENGKGHCELSFISEREQRQMPPEARKLVV